MPVGENNIITLSDLRGRIVVLYFYPKDNTPGCIIKANGFNNLKSEFTKMNAVIIEVSKDNLTSYEKFKEKYSLKFDLASDYNLNTCQQYGVWVEKSMFGKYMAIQRTTFLIDQGGLIAYIWPKVQIVRHAEAVLEQVGKKHV